MREQEKPYALVWTHLKAQPDRQMPNHRGCDVGRRVEEEHHQCGDWHIIGHGTKNWEGPRRKNSHSGFQGENTAHNDYRRAEMSEGGRQLLSRARRVVEALLHLPEVEGGDNAADDRPSSEVSQRKRAHALQREQNPRRQAYALLVHDPHSPCGRLSP